MKPGSGHTTSVFRPATLFGAGALVLMLLLAGCEEDVVAVTGSGMPYSLNSVFSPELDTQWVRVFPHDEILKPTPGARLDARVTTTDLETGEVTVWRDSLLREANGDYSHLYWFPFTAEYGHTYRLEVERSDGEVTWADAAVPARTEMVLLPPVTSPPLEVASPVLVKGDVPRLRKIVTVDSIIARVGSGIQPATLTFEYTVPPERTEEGWLLPINIWHESEKILLALRRRPGFSPNLLKSNVQLISIEVHLHVVNETWDPRDGATDEEVLADPTVLWNVENGFGFVGAGYHQQIKWTPPDSVLEAAGFGFYPF